MQQCVGLLGHRGANFTFVTKLAFNGKTATFTINSDTQTSTSVPASASPGMISVTSPRGTSTSVGNFAVTPKGLAVS